MEVHFSIRVFRSYVHPAFPEILQLARVTCYWSVVEGPVQAWCAARGWRTCRAVSHVAKPNFFQNYIQIKNYGLLTDYIQIKFPLYHYIFYDDIIETRPHLNMFGWCVFSNNSILFHNNFLGTFFHYKIISIFLMEHLYFFFITFLLEHCSRTTFLILKLERLFYLSNESSNSV